LNGRMTASLIVSVTVGVAIALVSGLFRTALSRIGVDVVLRGTPLPWIIQVIPRPYHILWANLAPDVAFWVAIASLASVFVMHVTRKPVQT